MDHSDGVILWSFWLYSITSDSEESLLYQIFVLLHHTKDVAWLMRWTIKHEYHRHNWRQYELKSTSNKPSSMYKWIKALFRSDVIIIYTRIWKQQTNQSVSTACRPDRHHWQNKRDRQKDQRGSEPASRAPMSINQNRGPTLIAEWKYNDMNVINYSTAPSCFWQLFRPGPLAFINNSPMTGGAPPP